VAADDKLAEAVHCGEVAFLLLKRKVETFYRVALAEEKFVWERNLRQRFARRREKLRFWAGKFFPEVKKKEA